MHLSPTETFDGKNFFIIGATGFIGKVALSMLLHRFPNVGKVYVTVRARSQEESEQRFWRNIITARPFDPLRELYGGALEGFIREKVVPVNGDVGETNLGIPEDELQRIMETVDVTINNAGNVNFTPPLETALRTNVVGTRNIIALVKRMKRPALMHVSTCFVAGNRSGAVWENEPVVGYFPRREELKGVEFSAEQEIEECRKLAERVREEARDAMQTARFRELARQRFIEEGRDDNDPDALGLAVARERKVWIRQRLTDVGMERAQFWGWPNIYTYAKSLGEQLVAAEKDIVKAIVRPSIVESAQTYPFPGWNEGFTTTAPLIFLSFKGQVIIPANDNLILDVTPVDYVSSVMLTAAAQILARDDAPIVYQAATGDANPINMKRIVEMVGLYKRKHYADKETGNKLLNSLQGRMEARTVSYENYERRSAPMFNRAAKAASSFLDRINPTWGGGRVNDVVAQAKNRLAEVEQQTHDIEEAFKLFKPFTCENEYIYRADQTRALFAQIPEAERGLLSWTPEKIDWYDYWMNVHFPGLKKWVFPTLEDELKAEPKRVTTYRDLLELFENSARKHATRVAMRIERNGVKEQYTYQDVQELATRAAGFLASQGIKNGQRVMLLSHNAPEWGMTYFGVMKTGATCIPLDPESRTADIVKFAASGEASGIVLSAEMAEKHADLAERLTAAGLSVQLWQFAEVFALPDLPIEAERLALLPKRKMSANAIASLIFTSGTTGQPKAVMLTHKNFTSMTSMLTSVIDMDTTDGTLSVLPLHHTFEFSAGFLAPLSRGAQITYLEELNSESLNKAIQNGHVTGMVGVPALWELLHRRIKNRFQEQGGWFSELMDGLIAANSWLRDKTPLNLGQVLFYPVHQGLGGRIRYFISGGSALNDKIQKDFHGLGFTMLEGYGLTEASPVLTVTRPTNGLMAGSVGYALPGVEVKILDPDPVTGVGEVVARGPNVMAGYYKNEAATQSALVDRWLHTGDLGRLDEDGNLFLVGRSKEIIVDSNGKNVYPDEIEDLYSDAPFIEELSVVGLPDETGEKIACLVRPNYDHDLALDAAAARRKVEEHFRDISSTLPFYKRVKVLHFTDDELPRTATRKVKRREVVELLESLEDSVKSAARAAVPDSKARDNAWLLDIVASVSNRSRSEVSLNSRLADLGFDSLMFVELASAIENAGGVIATPNALNEVHDVRELAALVTRGRTAQARRAAEATRRAEEERQDSEEIYIPSLVREIGGRGVDLAQRFFYEKVLDCSYEGRANIPPHVNYIVAPNHTSHLDMGLTKMALGDAGEELVALAAADYFFDNKYKRAYMDNFTNLVPMERSGSLRQSLRHARSFLERGYNALIFPEGTRSLAGEIADFKPIIGYLALACKVGILPVYLWGTHEAYPKGATLLKARKVGARIGQYIDIEELETMTKGMPKADAYKLIAARVEHEVKALRDGTKAKFDADAFKKQLRQERRQAKANALAAGEE